MVLKPILIKIEAIISDWICPPPSPCTTKYKNLMIPNDPRAIIDKPRVSKYLNALYIRMVLTIVAPDFLICDQTLPIKRDSPLVLALKVIGISIIVKSLKRASICFSVPYSADRMSFRSIPTQFRTIVGHQLSSYVYFSI